jgi:hypothetical protein
MFLKVVVLLPYYSTLFDLVMFVLNIDDDVAARTCHYLVLEFILFLTMIIIIHH